MAVMNHLLLTSCLLLAMWASGLAQDLEIRGRVLNQADGTAIAFATIRLGGTAFGTVSNEWGAFVLRLPEKREPLTLCVSSIGFLKLEEGLEGLASSDELVLRLTPSDYQLEEVSIEDKLGKLPKARKLVRKAVRRIQALYGPEPFLLTGYFRSYYRQQDAYLNLLEAGLQVYDPGYQTDQLLASRFYLLNSRYRPDIEVDASRQLVYDHEKKDYLPGYSIQGYGGNDFTLLVESDPLRNHQKSSFAFVYEIKRDFLTNHRFELEDIVMMDTLPMYKINFHLNRQNPLLQRTVPHWDRTFVQGYLYLRSDDLALAELHYANYAGSSLTEKRYEVEVVYQRVGASMYPNYLSMNNQFFWQADTTAAGEPVYEELHHYREFFVNDVQQVADEMTSEGWPISKLEPIPILNLQQDFGEGVQALMKQPLRKKEGGGPD